MDWSQCPVVDRDPQRVGGAWCFIGTRLPVVSLFDYLDRGSSLDDFFQAFPDIDRHHVHEVLAFAKRSLDVPTLA